MRPGRQSDLRAGWVNPKAYKKAVGRFATGVTVVTTHLDDDHFAITISSFTSVSLDPVQVLVCVEKTTRFHPAVLAAGRWAVSVLAVGQEDVSRWFATRGRSADPDQFAGFAHHAGALTGAVLFDEALTQLECRTVAAYDGGDHAIILGEVIGVDTSVDGPPKRRYPPSKYTSGSRLSAPASTLVSTPMTSPRMIAWSPPSYAATVRHSSWVKASSKSTAPVNAPAWWAKPANWSGSAERPRVANQRETSSWPTASTETAHWPAAKRTSPAGSPPGAAPP